jgi:NADH-quinone oxidoreductase subunit H
MDFLNDLFVNLNTWFAGLLARFLPGWAVDLIIMVLVAVLLVVFAVVVVLSLIYIERKVVARMQDRIGPNRVGPLGLLQPIADVVKILTKEDITPTAANRWVFNLGPILFVPPALMALAVIPFGKGMIGTDLNIGFLYLIAVSSTSTIAIVMSGWGSNNKFALLGAMRAAAQIVSYEVPQVLSVIGVLILAGSLSMVRIVEAQDVWFVVLQPIAFLLFVIASIAEINRSPFDIPEAESEIVAGYHTEYSGLKFGLFYVAEYINTFTVSAVATTLFLGGWAGPVLPGWLWFLVKTYFMIFVLMWVRGTLPRLRVDQLMNLAWKFLVPLALGNLLVSGVAATLAPAEAGIGLKLAVFTIGNLLLITATIVLLSLRPPSEEKAVLVRREGVAVR